MSMFDEFILTLFFDELLLSSSFFFLSASSYYICFYFFSISSFFTFFSYSSFFFLSISIRSWASFCITDCLSCCSSSSSVGGYFGIGVCSGLFSMMSSSCEFLITIDLFSLSGEGIDYLSNDF